MIRTYTKTLLSPFVGVVQVTEVGEARALSLDGKAWAIQYSRVNYPALQKFRMEAGLDEQYSLVATVVGGRIKRHPLHPFLEPGPVHSAIDRLADGVSHARVPFAATDRYQYWLLDGVDGSPLALLHSCVREEEMACHPVRASWVAMPAAQLPVSAPDEVPGQYVPPVNYRLQKLIEERAGARPGAQWFDRSAAAPEDFPPCLIQEHWDREEHQLLCDRYIERLAPRLLMLQGLPHAVRRRLEIAARHHVLDVENFHLLYPEVIDRDLMAAARVEARIRRAALA